MAGQGAAAAPAGPEPWIVDPGGVPAPASLRQTPSAASTSPLLPPHHNHHQQQQQQEQQQPAPDPDPDSQDADADTTGAPRRPLMRRLARLAFRPRGRKGWAVCVAFWVLLIGVSLVLFTVLFPILVDHVILPLVRIIRGRFSTWEIALMAFFLYMLLPMLVCVPYNWVAWLLGATLSFGQAFGIIMFAAAVGMAIQYWLARTVLHDRVQRQLQQVGNKRAAALLRAVDLLGPIKFTLLLRLAPYPPYQVSSYLLAIPCCITFWIYELVSVPAEMPCRALQIMFGSNLGTFADLLRGNIHSPGIVAYNLGTLAIGALLVGLITWYAVKVLKRVEAEEAAREAADQQQQQQGEVEELARDVETGPDTQRAAAQALSTAAPGVSRKDSGGASAASASDVGAVGGSSSSADLRVLLRPGSQGARA